MYNLRLLPILLLVLTGLVQAGEDAHLTSVLKGAQRSAENKARDKYRHPAETLQFFGLKDNMTVVEFWAGGGWYTEVLAPYLKDNGHYIGVTYDRDPATQKEWMANSNKKFDAMLAATPDAYAKAKVVDVALPKRVKLADEGTVDMILDFRNAHNWMRQGADEVAAGFFKALKKGGVVGIVDHRCPEDHEYDERNGYIKVSQLTAVMEKAGFKLEASSEINANPKDTKDHPEGVWTLPPVLALEGKDQAKYIAIGESDRFTLKFVKP